MDAFVDVGEFSPSLETSHLVSRQDDALSDFNDVAGTSNTDLNELSRNGNFSSREYNAYVYSLNRRRTGCDRRGALPVPLAANDTCLPGWNCECCHTFQVGERQEGKLTMTCNPQANNPITTTHPNSAHRPKNAKSSARTE